MHEELIFNPFPYLENPHHQTIVSGLFSFSSEPESTQRLILLPDGDRISLEISTPKEWKPDDPTVVMIHGLCGSHRSPNLTRTVKRLLPKGIRSVRFNMRGCGSGRGMAKHIYHGGRSDDLFECIKILKKEAPDSPITLIGFSLGANISLKLSGELGDLGSKFLDKVIAVSPPVDLYSSIQKIGSPENEMYESYFYRLLRADVYHRHRTFKDLPPVSLPIDLKLYEFDQIYVAPQCNFKSAHDYYDRCSSIHFIPQISIPCKILLSEDDPIVSSTSLDSMDLPSNIRLFKTKKGGHMGYIGNPSEGFFWLDSLLSDWIQET